MGIMADRGVPPNISQNHTLTPKVPTLARPNASMGCDTEFQLFNGNSTKENAANLAGFNGVKDVVEGVYVYSDYIALFPILATHWGALV
jgi:hypothetical protein